MRHMMKNLFWECFCETGKIDMYLLYKEYEEGEKNQEIYEMEQTQSSQVQSDLEGSIG